jgi:mannose-1-phosphate guanylyltransferase
MARYAVILAGGRGDRFWPLSRPERPKHLLPLFRGKTLLEHTLMRLERLVELQNVRIITSAPQEDLLRRTLPQFKPSQILIEPEGRDTAAAVALATRLIQREDPTATFAVFPADHFITNIPIFRQTLKQAFDLAEGSQCLVTLGIAPTRPATGYGYLERGESLGDNLFRVGAFKEKPSLSTAQKYISDGAHLWNSGIFVWSVPAIVRALEAFVPEIWKPLSEIDPLSHDALSKIYPTLPKTSIDYGVMEHASDIYAVEANFGWDDVGEWPSLARLLKPNEDDNITLGNVVTQNGAQNILVNDDPDHLVAVLGGRNMVVAHTRAVTFVAPADNARELRSFLAELRKSAALKKFTD